MYCVLHGTLSPYDERSRQQSIHCSTVISWMNVIMETTKALHFNSLAATCTKHIAEYQDQTRVRVGVLLLTSDSVMTSTAYLLLSAAMAMLPVHGSNTCWILY